MDVCEMNSYLGKQSMSTVSNQAEILRHVPLWS